MSHDLLRRELLSGLKLDDGTKWKPKAQVGFFRSKRVDKKAEEMCCYNRTIGHHGPTDDKYCFRQT